MSGLLIWVNRRYCLFKINYVYFLMKETEAENKARSSENLVFPIMALLAGVLGGVFGIGGGMLISPLLLQMGIKPEVS